VGLLDSLLGRSKPVRANLDALFALPSAAITLQTAAGLVSSGMAGVCWKPPAGQSATDVQREIGELLQIDDESAPPGTGGPAGALTQAADSFGYRWLLLEDPDIEALVTRAHLVNSTLTDNGWGPQLLCSVFPFVPAPDADMGTKGLFLVYLYKRGTFYPFAPAGGERRDTELELRIRTMVGADLPFESDLSRWFPMWDMPVA
jgi:PspA associated protein B